MPQKSPLRSYYLGEQLAEDFVPQYLGEQLGAAPADAIPSLPQMEANELPLEDDTYRGLRSTTYSLNRGDILREALQAEVAGNPARANELRAQAQAVQETGQMFAPRRSSFTQVENVSDAVDYLQGGLGQVSATMAGPMAGGIAGSIAGGLIAGPIGAYLGAAAGGALPAFQMEAGEQASSFYDDPYIRENVPAKEQLREVNVKGAQNAALELAFPALLGGRVIGGAARRIAGEALKRSPLRRTKAVARETGVESATELSQTLTGQASLTRLNPNRDTSHDYIEQIDSIILGALGGSSISLGTTVPGYAAERIGQRLNREADEGARQLGRGVARGRELLLRDLEAEVPLSQAGEGANVPLGVKPSLQYPELTPEQLRKFELFSEQYEYALDTGDTKGQEEILSRAKNFLAEVKPEFNERDANILNQGVPGAEQQRDVERLTLEQGVDEEGNPRLYDPEMRLLPDQYVPMFPENSTYGVAKFQRAHVRRGEEDSQLQQWKREGFISESGVESAKRTPLGDYLRETQAAPEEIQAEADGILRDIGRRLRGASGENKQRLEAQKAALENAQTYGELYETLNEYTVLRLPPGEIEGRFTPRDAALQQVSLEKTTDAKETERLKADEGIMVRLGFMEDGKPTGKVRGRPRRLIKSDVISHAREFFRDELKRIPDGPERDEAALRMGVFADPRVVSLLIPKEKGGYKVVKQEDINLENPEHRAALKLPPLQRRVPRPGPRQDPAESQEASETAELGRYVGTQVVDEQGNVRRYTTKAEADPMAREQTKQRTQPRVKFVKRFTRDDIQKNANQIYVFGDNLEEKGYGGQAASARGEENTIGVPTKYAPRTTEDAYFGKDIAREKQAIQEAFAKIRDAVERGVTVVFPEDGLGTGRAELRKRAPELADFIDSEILKLQEGLPEDTTREPLQAKVALPPPKGATGQPFSTPQEKRRIARVRRLQKARELLQQARAKNPNTMMTLEQALKRIPVERVTQPGKGVVASQKALQEARSEAVDLSSEFATEEFDRQQEAAAEVERLIIKRRRLEEKLDKAVYKTVRQRLQNQINEVTKDLVRYWDDFGGSLDINTLPQPEDFERLRRFLAGEKADTRRLKGARPDARPHNVNYEDVLAERRETLETDFIGVKRRKGAPTKKKTPVRRTPLPKAPPVQSAPKPVAPKPAPAQKTASGNVVVKNGVPAAKAYVAADPANRVYTLRNYGAAHYGNPFTHLPINRTQGTVLQVGSVAEAVQAYRDWLTTTKYDGKFGATLDARKKWILQQLPSLKGKELVYYKELNEPSHANVLDELVQAAEAPKAAAAPKVPTPPPVQSAPTPKVNIASSFRGRGQAQIAKGVKPADVRLAAALTNVTFGEYQVDNVPGLKKPDPKGNHKLSAEAWYKANKTNDLAKDKAVMQRVIEAKLRQYPNLVKGITDRGGVAWIENAEHKVTGKGRWEGEGRQSNFLDVLAKAYEAVTGNETWREGLPTHSIDRNLKNKDGSKRLAATSKDGKIRVNPVATVEEFFSYFTGQVAGESSQQKAKVLAELAKQKWPEAKIRAVLHSADRANRFLVLHEQDHIDNGDRDVYWLQGDDLLTDDKIAMETRASRVALEKIAADNRDAQRVISQNIKPSRQIPDNEVANSTVYARWAQRLKERGLQILQDPESDEYYVADKNGKRLDDELNELKNALNDIPTDLRYDTLEEALNDPEIQVRKEAATRWLLRAFGPEMLREDRLGWMLARDNALPMAGFYDVANDFIKLAVDSLDPLSIAFHEGMHKFVNTLNTSGNQALYQRLVKAVSAPHVMKQMETLLADYPQAIDQIRTDPEEAVAYAFQFYAASLERGGPAFRIQPSLKQIFRKIGHTLLRMLGIMTHARAAEQIFEALRTGEAAPQRGGVAALQKYRERSFKEYSADTIKILKESVPSIVSSPIVRLQHMTNDRGEQIQAFVELANKWFAEPLKGGESGVVQRTSQMEGQYHNRWRKILRDHNVTREQMDSALLNFQSMRDPRNAFERDLQHFFERMYAYSQEGDNPVKVLTVVDEVTGKKEWLPPKKVKRYFPRMWSIENILANEIEFREVMQRYSDMTEETITNFIDMLRATDGLEAGSELQRYRVDFSPYQAAINARVFDFINESNAHEFAKFQEQNMAKIMDRYIRQATHRREHSRTFGHDGKIADDLIKQAKREGATDQQIAYAEKVVKGMEGRLGTDKVSSLQHEVMVTAMSLVNFAVLPFALLSSQVDPLGVLVRTGSLKQAYNTYKAGIRQIVNDARKKKSPDQELAEYIGAIEDDMVQDLLNNTERGLFMNETLRRLNKFFFKSIGLEQWTRGTRIGALRAGIEYLKANADNAEALKELGLEPGQIQAFEDRIKVKPEEFKTGEKITKGDIENARKVQNALYRMVDESILRPSAGTRPLWMSDMRFLLLGHLKSFTFTYHNTILRQLATKAKSQEDLAHAALVYAPLLSYIPVMIAADTLRDALRGKEDDEDRDLADVVGRAIQRSAVLGWGTFLLDIENDMDFDQLPVNTLLGPTVDSTLSVGRAVVDPDVSLLRTGRKLLPYNAMWRHWGDDE